MYAECFRCASAKMCSMGCVIPAENGGEEGGMPLSRNCHGISRKNVELSHGKIQMLWAQVFHVRPGTVKWFTLEINDKNTTKKKSIR